MNLRTDPPRGSRPLSPLQKEDRTIAKKEGGRCSRDPFTDRALEQKNHLSKKASTYGPPTHFQSERKYDMVTAKKISTARVEKKHQALYLT